MPGRHRHRRGIRGLGAVAGATALVVLAAGAWYGYQRLARAGCSGKVQLSVAAAPEIAPAVAATAAEWVDRGAAVSGTCVAVQVTAISPVDVAAAVASQHAVAIAGVGEASGTAVLPHVWIPDSSTWLLRLRQQASGFTPGNGGSVARSPVVVAMPEPVAATVGWPERQPGWSDLLQRMISGTRLRAGIVEPSRDAAGLSGLLALSAAGGSGVAGQRNTIAALRALATSQSAVREDLLARFPRSADPRTISVSLGAAALSEVNVIEFNAKRPPIPLAALYLQPAPLALDYPFAVLPGAEPARVAAAEALFGALGTERFRDQLAARGLRAPDGSWGKGFAAPRGAPGPHGTDQPTGAGDRTSQPAGTGGTGQPTGTPNSTGQPTAGPGGPGAGGGDPAVIDRVLSSWSVATQSGRMLAVIDVSGSMTELVATAGNATRAEVTLAAARRGLALFDDTWALGLWIFSTGLVGQQDHRQLVPIGPLSSQRGAVEKALAGIAPKPGGGTGLYDTMLTAYRTVQNGWEDGRVNSVVLMTDGQNDDRSGITQEKLLAELKRLADPERPIQVVIIGIGGDVSRAELESITKVTGGGVFVTEDPARIGDIFLQALALRPPATR